MRKKTQYIVVNEIYKTIYCGYPQKRAWKIITGSSGGMFLTDTEKIGCIEIGNNVFIGADAKILYNDKVGDNVIIAAGALVNKDVPSNSVWGGTSKIYLLFRGLSSKAETVYCGASCG